MEKEDEIAKAVNDLKKALSKCRKDETEECLKALETLGIERDDAIRRADLLPATLWHVQLWRGGYTMNPPVDVYARDEEEALILASIHDSRALFVDVCDVPKDERDDYERADNYLYLDRTEYGHSCGYLCIENAVVC